VMEE